MEKTKNNFRNQIRNRYLALVPKMKEQKTQMATTVSLTFLGITILGLFAISPTLSTIAKLRKTLSDNTILLENIKQKNVDLSTLYGKYSTLKNDVSLVLKALPKSSESPLLLAQIQSLLQTNRLALLSLATSEVELTKKEEGLHQFSSYSFNLTVEGSYNDVLNFVSTIVDIERIISIDSVSIIKNSKGGSQMVLSGKAYFKK